LAVASRRGALIKGGAALEQLGRIRQVAFDKTGTLTVGQPRVTAAIALNDVDENDLLALAAAVEQGSSHPLAQAIVREAQQRQLTIPS
ncbi:HAD family hydrolase, partial [Klebsiella pneumoniae]|nr:HAD family hydrolase [Klebsiella pneumoniae]